MITFLKNKNFTNILYSISYLCHCGYDDYEAYCISKKILSYKIPEGDFIVNDCEVYLDHRCFYFIKDHEKIVRFSFKSGYLAINIHKIRDFISNDVSNENIVQIIETFFKKVLHKNVGAFSFS